jgi:hypothetical protein
MPVQGSAEHTTGIENCEGVRLLRALRHLNHILPLKHRQVTLPAPLAMVHRSILRSLAERGRPLTRAEIAGILGNEKSALNALAVLGSNDLIVLNSAVTKDPVTKRVIIHDPAGVEVVGAYPMTTATTPHKVTLYGHEIFAMCALDGMSIAPMFNTETRIESKCHVTGEPIKIRQKGMELLEASPSVQIQFGIRWQKVAGSAAHGLCKEMVFLKDEETARSWKSTDPDAIETFNLAEALELGAAFFVPLLEDGEPAP